MSEHKFLAFRKECRNRVVKVKQVSRSVDYGCIGIDMNPGSIGWAYSEFFKLLNSILSNRGIELLTVNPAYSSIIGLVKYLKMYGLASEVAAALVIARRGRSMSEKIPGSLTAFVEVNSTKHVWSLWNQLNKKIKQSGIITNRHSYYSNSNWDFLGNLNIEEA